VQDIGSYRRDNPAAVLPRTLLIIDEFQEFFSEDDKLGQDAAVLLDRLVRQGRAFGIHLLLGSQTISGSSGLSRSTIGQMAVRIALQMSEADSQLILGDANSAARLLSRPGEAIYNDAGGLVEGNSPFQIAWLPDEQRDVFLERIQHQARQRGIQTPAPVVFEGNMPAEVRKNDLLRASLAGHGRLGAPAAAPRAWLGEPVAIKDPTAITFRRQSGANALIVGQADEQAMALVCAAMISLASQHTKDSARFYVFDGTPADSPLAGMMQRVSRAIPQAVRHVEYRATAEVIGEIAAEVRQRQDADAHDAPALYVLLIGLQRYRVLRRSEEGFGFSLEEGEKPPQPDRQLAR
jgi:DNA segregation ATPase FtsK/SpoIIIE-like protein